VVGFLKVSAVEDARFSRGVFNGMRNKCYLPRPSKWLRLSRSQFARSSFYFVDPLRPFSPSWSGSTNRSSSMLIVTAVTRPTTETSSGKR